MKIFNLCLEQAETYFTDKNHKKLIFLFSASYYILMISILYFVFSENLGVFTYDSGHFHSEAIRYANLLKVGGLFSLPNIVHYDSYQFPGIFGGIIYYLFGFQHPFLIVIFNILIKSISIYLLYSISFKLTEKKLLSFLAIAPFMFFPTEFGNIALINKGIFFSLGIILVLSFFVETNRKTLIIYLIFSALILFLVRPQYIHWTYSIVFPPTELTGQDNFIKETTCATQNEFKNICKNTMFGKYIFPNKWRQKQPEIQLSMLEFIFEKICSRFDGLAKTLASIRDNSDVQTSNSNFDYSTLPSNGKELIYYMPKGLLIGLFKPYPTEWFEFENKTNKMAYLASSFETMIVYLGIMLLPFSLYKWRMRKALYPIIFLCLFGILTYGSLSYNLGCLYRQRGLFINIVCGIGLMSFPLLFDMVKEQMFVFRRLYMKTKSNPANLSNFPEITG